MTSCDGMHTHVAGGLRLHRWGFGAAYPFHWGGPGTRTDGRASRCVVGNDSEFSPLKRPAGCAALR